MAIPFVGPANEIRGSKFIWMTYRGKHLAQSRVAPIGTIVLSQSRASLDRAIVINSAASLSRLGSFSEPNVSCQEERMTPAR